MKTYSYFNTTKLVTTSLLDMFNDIKVKHYDISGSPIKEYFVELGFGPDSKPYMSRLVQESNQKYYIQGTKIGVVFKGYTYDSDRERGSTEYIYFNDDSLLNDFYKELNPIPVNYNFNFTLKTFAMDLFSQVMEQIIPYFRPSLTLRVKEFSFLNIERDLGVYLEDEFPNDFIEPLTNEDRREFSCSFNITVKGFMYRPISTESIIKIINSKYFIENEDVEYLVDEYRTSAFDVSATNIPTNYLTSAFDIEKNVYVVKVGL